MIVEWFDSQVFQWVVLPLLIFLARLVDVTLGTLRVIFTTRGMRLMAPLFGFFEILIWLMAIGQVMQHLNNPLAFMAYAGGFSLGVFCGIVVEDKISIGTVVVRIITAQDPAGLIERLEAAQFGVTQSAGQGVRGKVTILFTVIRRTDLKAVVALIREVAPDAFYSVEDLRYVRQGVFPPGQSRQQRQQLRQALRLLRKGK